MTPISDRLNQEQFTGEKQRRSFVLAVFFMMVAVLWDRDPPILER